LERKLTAILCADVYGYSRLMGEDEEATLRTLSSHRKLIDSLIEQHRGRFVNSAGDSVLAEFTSVVEAVNCAVEIQTALRVENANLSRERRMEFRIGVNSGDVMVDGVQIYGDGVNVAARLESLADPGGICISGTVYEQVRDKLALRYDDRGEQTVKNIARPVHIWRIALDGMPASFRRLRSKYRLGGVLSLTGLAIVVGIFVLVQHLSLKPPHTSASIPPPEKPALTLPTMPSIAVLPFTNLTGDPQQEYFSDGISDQLISELSRLPGLFVIARNSSFAYKGQSIKEHEISRELGVKYVLEGNVHKTPDHVRIGVDLVDAASATEMWTQTFDRPLKDIFAVQDEIVRRVVTTLGLIFKLQQMNVPWSPGQLTDNLEAFDEFLRANQYFWRLTKEDNPKARQWDEKAVALDPGFADAYVQIGWTYFADAAFRWGKDPQGDWEHLRESAQKALALDDSNCGALGLMTRYDVIHRQFDRAVADGERAVATNPNCTNGYWVLSDTLIFAGKPNEAISAAEKATRLDPAGRDFYDFLFGRALYVLGRPGQAIPFLQRHAAAFPSAPWVHLDLAIAYIEAGRDQDAKGEAAEITKEMPHFALPPPERGAYEDVALNRRFDDDLRKAGLKWVSINP
jgi:adenylate cyclase